MFQVAGGALEIALGAGGLAAPTGVTQVGGVILIAHGSDTLIAGFRSIWTGDVQSTLTQQGAAAAASKLGASPRTADRIGTGVDLIAGAGPSLAFSVSRRIAIAGAETATERVAVAYLSRGALDVGHNVVGVRLGGTTAWIEFAGKPIGRVARAFPPSGDYVVTELAVSAEEAASADAARRVLAQSGKEAWGVLGPNCATVAKTVLQEAGIVVPE